MSDAAKRLRSLRDKHFPTNRGTTLYADHPAVVLSEVADKIERMDAGIAVAKKRLGEIARVPEDGTAVSAFATDVKARARNALKALTSQTGQGGGE